MAKYSGRKGTVYLATSGGGTASKVIGLSKWTIDRTTDKKETTAFGDANKTYVQGLPDLKGTFEGWWDDTESKVLQGAGSSDGVKLYLYPSSDAAADYWYGPAWLDASMETGVDDVVKIKGTFAANGSWGNTF